jgi:SNF2 family DNA or RNA helicase
MALLHGSWVTDGYFCLWGETWRRFRPIAPADMAQLHPFAMAFDELIDLVRSRHLLNPETLSAPLQQSRSAITLPSELTNTQDEVTVVPLHSASRPIESVTNQEALCLYPWLVEGVQLPPLDAMRFLSALPLGIVDGEENFVGDDLRFWSYVARWSLDLMARAKILPILMPVEAGGAIARWQPLLDSAVDQARLQSFVQHMPLACQTYQHTPSLAVDLPRPPQHLLLQFLEQLLDAQTRSVTKTLSLPPLSTKGNSSSGKLGLLRDWLTALGTSEATLTGSIETLATVLESWLAPIQRVLRQQNQFRACFYLHAPTASHDASPRARDTGANTVNYWTLEYFLQSAVDPSCLISAATVWNSPVERLVYRGQTIDHPQEALLIGLGLASRLYPPLEPSLQTQRPQVCTLTPLQAYDFIKTVAWRLQDSGFGVILPASLSNREAWASRLGLKVTAEDFSLKSNQRLGLQSLLNFRWELSIGGHTLSKAEFDRLVAQDTPLVEIKGEWVELRPQDVRAAQAFFASRKDQMAFSLEDALRISTGDTQTVEKLPVVSFEASGALQELITTLTGNRTIEAIPTPTAFRGELRPYQSRGAGWLAFLEQWGLGACLADDMGLGKTIQTIAFLLHLQQEHALENPTLLVCPTSVLSNWEREVKKFGPALKSLLHHGDKRSKGKAFNKTVQGKDLVITSYALLHRDAKELQSVSWQGIIVDEAQNIKNAETKQSQTVRQLQANFRIALTGTPVENRLSELWSILDFLNPGYLGARNFFQRRFATPIERYGDTASLQTLRSLVQPFILRRLKTDHDIIQDLPEKQEMAVFCGLSAEQATLYQQMVEKSLRDIEAAEGIQRHGLILALLVKLKQICNLPEQFLGEKTISSAQRSGKLQRLQEMLEEVVAEGDRALIFTQFAECGKLLKAYLEHYLHQETLFLYGSTTKKQREDMIDRFQHDPQGPKIFILSLKAGGTGLNLTRANHVFHFDRWWNPAVENQATDRVFRIGQTRNVQVHKFICTGTLEERIHDLIESKKALADQVVGTGENWLTEMDTDQLRNLLLLDRSAVIDED